MSTLITTIQGFHRPESRYWTTEWVLSYLENASAITHGRSSISYATHLHPPSDTAMCYARPCGVLPMAGRRPEGEFESADPVAAHTVPRVCRGRRSPRLRSASSGSVFTIDQVQSGQPQRDASILADVDGAK